MAGPHGTFACQLQDYIDTYCAERGFTSGRITIEKVNEHRLQLVRSIRSSAGVTHETLGTSLPEYADTEANIRFKKLGNAFYDEATHPDDAPVLLNAYLDRMIRASRRNRAINMHAGSTNSSPWANTMHPLAKAFIESNGKDVLELCEKAYKPDFQTWGGASYLTYAWTFIEGYGSAEAVTLKNTKINISHMTQSSIMLDVPGNYPSSALLALSGAPISRLIDHEAVMPHANLKIIQANNIKTAMGELVLRAEIEAKEVGLQDAPDGFDTSWMI